MQYEIKPLRKEDEAYIGKKIGEYAYMMAPPELGTPEEEQIIFRAEDENGKIIGGCVIEAYEYRWRRMYLDTLWVDERYRHHGIGSMIIREIEREAREAGAYLAREDAPECTEAFFRKNDFATVVIYEDGPKWSVLQKSL